MSATPQIDRRARLAERNGGDEIARRTGALILEGDVLAGRPRHFALVPASGAIHNIS
jgi:hypothetical protein